MNKTQAISMFQADFPEILENCRYIAKRLAINNPRHEVTIDSIRAVYKLAPWVTPKMFGAVFKTDDWEAVGYVKSTRPEAHKRPVTLWRYKNAPKGQVSFIS